MFLFTNAPLGGTRDTGPSGAGARATASGSASPAVIEGIREGAQSTGVGFDYLLATAQRESSLNPTAKAGTSSATGLFQFIEQTWLGTMKAAGAKLGLGSYADAISARPDGSFTVSDAGAKQAILDLRSDPKVSATMAGALTQRNRDTLAGALGREPTSGDLYAAHVLGAKGAATLITEAQDSPARPAALDMPEAAAANRGLFYDKGGRPRGAAELYALLATATSGAPTPVAATVGTADVPTAYASLDGGIRALFQTDKRQGAVSDGVARLWSNRGSSADAPHAAPTYFPRSDAAQDVDLTVDPRPQSLPASASAPASMAVPLPPRRPAEFGSAASVQAKPSPFDLSSYTLRNGP